MAVLPIYDNRVGLDVSGSGRGISDSASQIGAAVSRFGEAAQGAYLQGEKADLTIAKIQEEEAKRAAGIDDAITRNEVVNSWQQKRAKLEADMPPSGEGFSATIEAAFDEHIAGYADKFSPLRGKENTELMMRFRTQEIGHAISLEAKTRRDTTAKLTDSDFKGYGDIAIEAGPAARETIMKEANLKADSYNFGPNMRAAYMKDAQKNMEAGFLTWAVKNNPMGILDAGQGVFQGMPVSTAPQEVKTLVNSAVSVGARADLVVAIAHIETGGKFDPNLKPIGRDGKPLSSAGGVLQTLDGAYGLGKDKSTAAQGKGLGLYLNDVVGKVEGKGIPFTPGAAMMFHNVGDRVALNLLQAAPDEKMRDIVMRSYPSDPAFAEKVLRNNPLLYNGNMTAEQVRGNYEAKMAKALKETQGLLSGRSETTDATANARLSEVIGVPVETLGAKGLKAAFDMARQDLSQGNKKQNDMIEGFAIHTGQVRIDVYDPTSAKKLDGFAETTGIAPAMLQGADEGFKEARLSVRNSGRLAKPYLHAARELIMSGEGNAAAQAKAYEFMSSIARDDPSAYDASGINGPVQQRIKEYRALTEGNDAIVSPAEAIKRINFDATVDGKSNLKAARALFQDNKKEELKALDVNDAVKKISENLWFNAKFFAPDSSTGDVAMKALEHNYKQAYEGYRIQGKDIEASKKLALQDVGDHYGVTTVGRGWTARGEITRFPIEKKYPAIDAKAPHQWITEQMRTRVDQFLNDRALPETERSAAADAELARSGVAPQNVKATASTVEMRLVPTDQTRSNWASGQPPSYALAFRNPRTGLIEVVDQNWRPDPTDAQRKFDEDFVKKTAAAQKSSVDQTINNDAANKQKPGTYSATGPSNYKRPKLFNLLPE